MKLTETTLTQCHPRTPIFGMVDRELTVGLLEDALAVVRWAASSMCPTE